MRRRFALLALLAAGVFVAPAWPGPCSSCAPNAPAGWWNDRPLAPGRLADAAPRIDVDGDGVTSRIAIVFERAGAGSSDVVVAISDDGGCSFTETTVAAGPEDDRSPDVSIDLSSNLVAIAFVRDGRVVATMSRDGGRSFDPPARVASGAPADASARPRIAMIDVASVAHVHVAWIEGGRIRLARNLASGASAAWTSGAPASDAFTGFGAWTSVEISADTRSSDPATQSAVTLAAAGLAPGSVVAEVFALRSNDSGTTFYGDPETTATRDVPRRVSPPRASTDPARSATTPQLDVSDDGSGEFYTWSAVGFTDRDAGEAMLGDARADEGTGPSTIADWNDSIPDVELLPSARAAAVAVIPNPLQRPPSPEAWFFGEGDIFVNTDVLAIRAMLDTSVPGWISETCPLERVTGVSPARSVGSVVRGSVAADEDLSHVFLAWADTRDGGTAIWWKRTDTQVEPASSVVAAPGDCAMGGGLTVSWTLPPSPPSCDVDHVRIEWGFGPGGRDGSADVSPQPPAQLMGFAPGQPLFVRVIVVDEACNEAATSEVAGTAALCGPVLPPNPVGGSLRVARRPTVDDVELRWSPPPVDAGHGAATSYDVHRSTLRAHDGFAVVSTAGPEPWVDSGGAAPGTARLHFYLVVARNSASTSGDEPLP